MNKTNCGVKRTTAIDLKKVKDLRSLVGGCVDHGYNNRHHPVMMVPEREPELVISSFGPFAHSPQKIFTTFECSNEDTCDECSRVKEFITAIGNGRGVIAGLYDVENEVIIPLTS